MISSDEGVASEVPVGRHGGTIPVAVGFSVVVSVADAVPDGATVVVRVSVVGS